ncbi:MAG: transglutaminase domain-containing protein [Thermoanaerobaculia bacterium]
MPHIAQLYDVNHIKARTVRPDGSIATFDGRTFDNVVVKVGGVRLIAKTFTLPDVQAGSIIEYRYDIASRVNVIYDTKFSPQRELPIIHEEILLDPYVYGGYNTFFSFRGLPGGKKPELRNSRYELTLENIPPFEEEPFAPPEATIKPELQFWYTAAKIEPDVFWTKEAHDWADAIEPFVGDGRAVKGVATSAMADAATPEEKVHKLYARVQEIRNLSFEPEKTDAETRKLKDNSSAQDVLRNGYGDMRDINRLFVSMARGAGFDAHVVRICERDEEILARSVPIGRQLDGELAVVTIDGKQRFFDPGTPYVPFEMLPWQKTYVPFEMLPWQKTSTAGLLIARRQEKAVWIDTPWLHNDSSVMKRVAHLQLEDGLIRGTVLLTYTGQEALQQRLAMRDDDDAAAKKSIEKELKGWFADGATVTLADVRNLRAAELPLLISATVELPSAASLVGSRAMVPLAIFAATQKNPFASERRKNAVYFHYAYRVDDDVTLKVPAGYAVESLPASADVNMGALHYTATVGKTDDAIRLVRNVIVDVELIGRDKYSIIRDFFSRAAAADQEQLVL